MENENGELQDTPVLVYDYCIMAPTERYRRCTYPVGMFKNFDWDEWNKYMELKNSKGTS